MDRPVLLALGLALLPACTFASPDPGTAVPAPIAAPTDDSVSWSSSPFPPDPPPDATISMSRMGCYGECPTYTVTLSADGTVSWHGHRFVAHEGEHTSRIDPAEFAALWREAVAQHFDELPSGGHDDDSASTCPMYATDMPKVSVEIAGRGMTRRVLDDHGCVGHPRLHELRPLEHRIDDVAETHRWLGG